MRLYRGSLLLAAGNGGGVGRQLSLQLTTAVLLFVPACVAALAAPKLPAAAAAAAAAAPRRSTRAAVVVAPVVPAAEAAAATAWAGLLEGVNALLAPGGAQQRRRAQLKRALLEECGAAPGNNNKNAKNNNTVNRPAVEAAIAALAATWTPSSPSLAVDEADNNSVRFAALSRRWTLVWTTEREINFFIDRQWSTAAAITQEIDAAQRVITNTIPFVRMQRDGNGDSTPGLRVTGRLSRPPGDPIARTQFAFDAAVVDLGPRWGTYRLPPVGRGWFDTVYLDDTFRVDRNSRGDILILTSSPPPSGRGGKL